MQEYLWERRSHAFPLHYTPANSITSICSGIVVHVVPTLLCSSWQEFDWHIASRGRSAIAELLFAKGEAISSLPRADDFCELGILGETSVKYSNSFRIKMCTHMLLLDCLSYVIYDLRRDRGITIYSIKRQMRLLDTSVCMACRLSYTECVIRKFGYLQDNGILSLGTRSQTLDLENFVTASPDRVVNKTHRRIRQ